MINFKKYQHIERFGNDEVSGIEIGTCYVFPKIDGTNGSIWSQKEKGVIKICAGSRNRELSLENDNAGFFNYVINDKRYMKFFIKYPDLILYGEWLVPHSLKTYRENAWRKFYVFDVCYLDNENNISYIPYDIYKEFLDEYNIDYIAPLSIVNNGDYDTFVKILDKNNFLIENGKGVGEGIVIKNYKYKNKYGRKTWAKIVTSEFKEKHAKTMGVSTIQNNLIEEDIANVYVTKALVEKEYQKIINEVGYWNSELIPRLLNSIYHSIITEDIWDILKKFKNPTINFKTLHTFVIKKIKEIKNEIF